MYDILSFDAEFGKILQELQVLVSRKEYLESRGGNDRNAISDLRFRGAPIEDLCLDFTLPGYPEYSLKPGEENVCLVGILFSLSTVPVWKLFLNFYFCFLKNFQVDINNLDEYISLVVDATVNTGIMRQMEAFRAGFNQVNYSGPLFDLTKDSTCFLCES